MPTAVVPRASPHPELAVFDLDACTWDKEMFELREIVDPTRSRRGSLGPDCGEGVVAAMSGNTPIALHPGALRAFQQIWLGTLETRAAAASSADTPLAVRIGRSALDVLEVFPGVTVRQVFAKGWPDGFEGNLQIGRTPPLSPRQGADALSDFTTRDGRRVLAHAVLRRLQLGRSLRRRRARVRVRGHRSRSRGRANAQRFARGRLGARLEPLRRPRRFLERRRVVTARRRVSLASRDYFVLFVVET